MNSQQAIKKIKVMLGMEKFAEQKLKDGSTIYYTELVEGQVITIKEGDEQVPAPAGEYILEDDTVITVEEEGIIKKIEKPEEEKPEEEKVEGTDEEPVEEPTDVEKTLEEKVANLTERVKMLEEAFAELLQSYESFSKDSTKKYNKFSKSISKKVEEIGKQPSEQTIKLTKDKEKKSELWEQRLDAIRNMRKNK